MKDDPFDDLSIEDLKRFVDLLKEVERPRYVKWHFHPSTPIWVRLKIRWMNLVYRIKNWLYLN